MSGPVIAETFPARLVESALVTPRVKRLVFERVDGQPFHFAAGQWVSVVLPILDAKGRPLRRSYSVASIPRGEPRFEVVVTRVDDGPGSTLLHDAPLGTELEVKGPQGFFTRPLSAAAPALLIATGTGLAPFRGMVHDALANGRTEPLWLLYGCRGPDDLLYGAELRALCAAHSHLRFEVTASRPPPGWTGRTGYVQTHVAELWRGLEALGTPPHAWICGVKAMLTEARAVLKEQLGVDRARIHLESYD